MSEQYPEAEIAAMDAKWYRLARFDSAIVSMNDGTSAALYKRDPELLPRGHEEDRRDPRAVPPGVAAAGASSTAPPWPTSPRRSAWEETLAPWMKGSSGSDD